MKEESNYINKLLKLIKEKRLDKRYTQEQMAFELESSLSLYGMIERGVRKLSLDYFIKIAKVLEYKPSELLQLTEKRKNK